MGTLRCVTLDLDDTLWDHRRAQAEALRLIASENIPAILVDTFIDRFHYHNKILWVQYGAGEVDVGTVKHQRFERALQDVGAALIGDIDRQLRVVVELQKKTISDVLGRYFGPESGEVGIRLREFVSDTGHFARLLQKH